jgi:hypothetical protein
LPVSQPSAQLPELSQLPRRLQQGVMPGTQISAQAQLYLYSVIFFVVQ